MTLSAKDVEGIIYNGLPAAGDAGVVVESVGGNRARVRFPFRGSMIRPGGTVSGPTMMSLADTAMYAAILGRLGGLEMAVTQNLNINFLSKPGQVDLIGEAEIIRLGRRSAVMEVRIYSEGSDEMVAHVTGTYALPGGKTG
ncbi:PaaI family thioesterase [Alloalcanivorax mobilis]|mgnify:CR=1 FL=1|uniref:PaaI family thioesterase n=1 Tax=Alloalcanivorax mobilis TaxID=2019569 RepID=UPI000B5B2319|nr:PaaI family thioesterase [Alloalcanivorax mobilis]ASK34642.1 thioesterase [Alcanivorax sp. N3-2A]|tara:strand:- start:21006 stop:21428 length:423 start_codon:yes stop_codon:yes gene_type:complete